MEVSGYLDVLAALPPIPRDSLATCSEQGRVLAGTCSTHRLHGTVLWICPHR